jgi:hypothetical protein
MLIIPHVRGGGRTDLDAFSFSVAEIAMVGIYVRSLGFEAPSKPLPSDNVGRNGERYSLSAQASTVVQHRLGVDFGSGRFIFRSEHGPAFRCVELALNSDDGQCVNIVAADAAEAAVKCALIANEKNWLGGVAQTGTCGAG